MEFITRNLPGQDRLGLFVPHNEHWSTIPILVYRVLFAGFGLHSYVPYILVLVVLHVIAAHLIWRLAIRAGASAWIATSVAALFLVLGVGWEQMIAAFQIGFSLSLVCGLGWLLVSDLDLQAPAGVLCGWVLGVAASMSSGIGVPMIGAVAVAELARRGPRAALLAASVPTLANLAWYAAVHPRATLPTTGQQLWMLPQFVWRGLSATPTGRSDSRWSGACCSSPWPCGWWGTCAASRPSPWAVLPAPCSSSSSSATDASPWEWIKQPRRATSTCAPPCWPAPRHSRSRQHRGGGCAAEALLVAALAVSTLHGSYVLRQNIRVQHAIEANDRAIIMAAASVVSSGATILGNRPDPFYGPDIDVADLRTLVNTGAFTPDPASIPQAC